MSRPTARRAPRVAYLTFSSGVYDARTMRMARSALAAGYEVTVYARWQRGLPPVERRDGYRVVRVPYDWQLLVPGLRGGARRRAAIGMAEDAAAHAAATASVDGGADGPPGDDVDERDAVERDAPDADATEGEVSATGHPDATPALDRAAARDARATPRSPGLVRRIVRLPRRLAGRVRRRAWNRVKPWWRLVKVFPLRPLGWALALDAVVEPADIWHGMWAGSLPALRRIQRRFGGRAIYDSRDVYMRSRDWQRAGGPGKRFLESLERRWAQAADRVLTVNDSYADLLVEQLRVPRPSIIMNCPETWHPPEPRPDLIRAALGLPREVQIVLYQGQFISDRGIEQTMDAMLEVPGALLALLGFGPWEKKLAAAVAEAPYAGRVAILPSVPPTELLDWTASADVSVMAIQPTSVNHRYTTPQKLFESIAAGVPVVASNLPGMAEVIRASDVGLVCDPTSPAAIAAAIRDLLSEPEPVRVMRRASILRLAHDRYNWERQAIRLLEVYRELLGDAAPAPREVSPPAGVAVGGVVQDGQDQDAAGVETVDAPVGASNRSSIDS